MFLKSTACGSYLVGLVCAEEQKDVLFHLSYSKFLDSILSNSTFFMAVSLKMDGSCHFVRMYQECINKRRQYEYLNLFPRSMHLATTRQGGSAESPPDMQRSICCNRLCQLFSTELPHR